MILFSYWFFFITTVAVVVGAHKMSFTLNWWAFIFPNAGMTLATIQAGKVLNSNALNGIASALTILLVIMWPGKDEDKSMERIAWGWQSNRNNPEARRVIVPENLR